MLLKEQEMPWEEEQSNFTVWSSKACQHGEYLPIDQKNHWISALKTLDAPNTAFKENIGLQVAGVSGHQNWKANWALWEVEDQLPRFWGAAPETPLKICCRKHARLGIRRKIFFSKSKIGTKKQTQPYPSGATARHCAVLPLIWHLHSSITSSWLFWWWKSRGRNMLLRSHAHLGVTLQSAWAAASNKQSLSM